MVWVSLYSTYVPLGVFFFFGRVHFVTLTIHTLISFWCSHSLYVLVNSTEDGHICRPFLWTNGFFFFNLLPLFYYISMDFIFWFFLSPLRGTRAVSWAFFIWSGERFPSVLHARTCGKERHHLAMVVVGIETFGWAVSSGAGGSL